jgi:hypothetical protein
LIGRVIKRFEEFNETVGLFLSFAILLGLAVLDDDVGVVDLVATSESAVVRSTHVATGLGGVEVDEDDGFAEFLVVLDHLVESVGDSLDVLDVSGSAERTRLCDPAFFVTFLGSSLVAVLV